MTDKEPMTTDENYRCSKCMMTFLPSPPRGSRDPHDYRCAEITRCSVLGCNLLFASGNSPQNLGKIRVWLVPDHAKTAEDKVREGQTP